MDRLSHILCIFLLILGLIEISYSQTIRYVKPVASGTGNGTSWANASNDLQLMINNSSSGDKIWVAAGTYLPNRQANNTGTITTANRNNAFVLKSGVSIYGGFSGNETQLSQRNLNNTSYKSILSGDFNGNDGANFTNMTENAYHIVIAAGSLVNTTLDGFTISGAYWASSPTGTITVNYVAVNYEYGGGLCIIESAPLISNIIFTNNNSYLGAGLYTQGSSSTIASVTPVIVNCTFFNNKATYGAGLLNYYTTASFFNCLFYGNQTSNEGAGAYNWNANVTYTNVTLTKNTAGANGGGMYHLSSTVNTRNSIVFGNTGTGTGFQPQVNFSGSTVNLFNNIFQGWAGGSNGNLNATSVTTSSLFIDYPNNDFRLKSGTSSINAGNNSYISGYSTDLDQQTRIVGANVDLGAYEYSKLKKWDRGSATNNWSDANNWIPNGVPVAGDSVVLDHTYLSGNYMVIVPNSANTISSLQIYPSIASDSIFLEIPSTVTTTNALRVTATGFPALCIGNRGRMNNRHGGGVNVNSVYIDNVQNYGMLLDTGAYYFHNTVTKDTMFLLNLNARNGSTFEYQRNINGTDNSFMVFPVTSSISQLKFYHLILSGTASFSPDYAVTLAKNWDLYIDGNLTVRNNACLGYLRGGTQPNRSIYLKGNVSAINTTNSSWMSANASIVLAWKIIFNGTTQQVVTGDISLEDYTLIDNPNGLLVNNNFIVTTNAFFSSYAFSPGLVFSNGIITTQGSGLVDVRLSATTAVSGHSTNGYVNGVLKRAVSASGAYDLPVGTATNYELATLTLNSITGPNAITTQFYSTGLGTIPTPLTESTFSYENLLNGGFWRITPNLPLISGNYSLILHERGYTNGGASQYTIVKRVNETNPWTLQGTYVSSGESGSVVTAQRSTFTGFSDFAIAFSAISPLPITLVSFDAYPLSNSKVKTVWVTASEINNDYFTIEKSSNGSEWTEVTKVSSIGNNNILTDYEAIDEQPYFGISYYRLKQTDFDGKHEYSEIKSVNLKRDYAAIEVYPNPASEYIIVAGISNSTESVELVDMTGIVLETIITGKATLMTLDLHQYPSGIYLIRTDNEIVKFVKL